MSRTGVCWPCYNAHHRAPVSVSRASYDAETGSRALLEGYARYWQNHVAGQTG